LAYYDIAISIQGGPNPGSAYTVYTKGLLLEEMGEYAEAEATFVLLKGSGYEAAGNTSLLRCQRRREGTYSMRADAQAELDRTAQKVAGKPGGAELLAAMRDAQEALFAHLDAHRVVIVPAANDSDGDNGANDEEEAVIAIAQQFVDLLLDRNYAAAKALLHSDLSKMSAKDLERHFEAMFADEEFPEIAHVLNVQKDLPYGRADDIASCYVTIESLNAEAVTVMVTREGSALKISEISWGRP